MKIVFMGTPDFAVGALRALMEAGHEVTAVVTQPDRARGRSDRLMPSPVKAYAAEAGIPILQPVRIRNPEAVEELKKYEADVYVVAAFGQILPKEVLDIPRLGCLNIHASLLPKYRGSSPIQWAVINGEEKTGVTIMQMDEGLDTGDILYRKEIALKEKETGDSLFEKLSVLGAQAIVEALPLLEAGELRAIPQNAAEATQTVMLKKSMGEIDWSHPAEEIERLIRGLNSWPSAYTVYGGRQLKIWEAALADEEADKSGAAPGVVTAVEKDRFLVACGSGSLWILALQLEGKRRMSAHDFLLGSPVRTGERLGGKKEEA